MSSSSQPQLPAFSYLMIWNRLVRAPIFLYLSTRCWTRDDSDDDDRRTTTMKKRAAERDVRAMAAALAERQGTSSKDESANSQQGMSLGVDVNFVIQHSDRKPFEGSLEPGMKLFASISLATPRETDKLYIAGVELVSPEDTAAQQLFPTKLDCVNTCHLSPQYFKDGHISFPLNPLTTLTSNGSYTFQLRYSGSETVAAADISAATAQDEIGADAIFTASSVAPVATDGGPSANSTATSPGLSSESNDIPKPTNVSPVSSTATPTTLSAAIPTGDPPAAAPASSPSTGLSTGAKAGIGVGVAAAVLIVIALVVAWWVRRSRRASSRNAGVGEKESVLAAAASGGGGGEYRDADEAGGGGGIVGGSPVTRKPVGAPAPVTNQAALADAVSPASTTVGVVGGQSRGPPGNGAVASQESMLNAEERERWEEEERRLDEDIAEAERRRLGA